MSDELRRIEREIRDWAARPPTISPSVARTRILARIEERRRWTGWKLAAAAVGVVGLASGLLLRGPEKPSDPPPEIAAARPSPALLVYELESGTQLYLALAATAVRAPTPQGNSTIEGDR